eukprot:TRINITY_DN8609_c0_g1_i2.p1 TRINITY_DN8609_c0_g1~~TRINITY_DN8609_c0_g1_i2.p1  ORF type:complete len:1440 (+),score=273.74 TRINITY_DN8609_c0_g1_i2:81-4400(+)
MLWVCFLCIAPVVSSCATLGTCNIDNLQEQATDDFEDEAWNLKISLVQQFVRVHRSETLVHTVGDAHSKISQHRVASILVDLTYSLPSSGLSILAIGFGIGVVVALLACFKPGDCQSSAHAECSSCDQASTASFLTYSWANPLVEAGVKRQVTLQDTPPLAPAEDTWTNTRRLMRLVEEEELAQRPDPLIRGTLRCFWPQLLAMQILNIASYLLRLLSPFLLQKVLVFQEAQEKGSSLSERAAIIGITAAFALVAHGVLSLFFNSQISMFKARITLRMDSALKGVVVARGLQGRTQPLGDENRNGEACGGAVYNVISFDVAASVNVIWVLLAVWLFPIELIAALAALFSQVAWAILPGLVTILIVKGAIFIMFFWDGVYRDRLYFAKDERLGLCGESFLNVRTLHMLGWTHQHESIIQRARGKELHFQWLRLWLQKMPVALDKGLPELVSLVTLSFVLATQTQLKASLALPVIALIKQLIAPLGQIPVWVNEYKVWRSAYDRTSRFLGFGHSKPGLRPPEHPRNGPTCVMAERCSFSWKSGFELRDISLQLKAGEHFVLVGKEAQGKTSLLLALMGEMPLRSGNFIGSASITAAPNKPEALPHADAQRASLVDSNFNFGDQMTAAFASQDVWIFAGTLRANVTFGLPFHRELFEKVLEACALKPDLKCLPLEDLTEIPAGGVTLSGGQRARVGLARACYCAVVRLQDMPEQPPLVLLDEPFCALDYTVVKEVCRSLFSAHVGILRQCPVIIAASDPWWLGLMRDPGLLVLRDGQIVAQGKLSELRSKELPELRELSEEAVHEIPQMCEPNPEAQKQEHTGKQDPLPSQKAFKYPVQPEATAQAEDREVGRVKLSTYFLYLQACGRLTFLALIVALICIMLFQNLCSLWIVYWTTEDKSATAFYRWFASFGITAPTEDNHLLRIYTFFILAFCVSNIAGHAFEIIGGIRASNEIFTQALRGALTRPFRWWDVNPKGRVLNRFSRDVEVMDLAVCTVFGTIIGAVLYFFGHVVVLTFSSPVALVLLPLMIMLIEYVAVQYRSTIREIQRVFLVSSSAVYQQMAEAIVGGVTVRAHGMKAEVMIRCLHGIENLQRASFTKSVLFEWVNIRMGLVGFILSTSTQLYPVLQYFGFLTAQSAALVGFAMTYSQDLVEIIQQFVMSFSEMEMQLISIERLGEYMETFPERPAVHAEQRAKLCSGEPSSGGMSLSNVEVTYVQGMPPVLQAVTLSFEAEETVAILGRTGAGKSSLLLAILQLVPYSGSIKIGSYNFGGDAQADEEARQRLVAVVPQHPVLFTGSLRWNLDPSNSFSDECIRQAVAAVGLQQACASKLGLEAQLRSSAGAGSTGDVLLSQGQCQSLCAARALLRRPKVALLDEVTAALPAATASSTVHALLQCFRACGATTLLVTHQEKLVSFCDRMVQLSGGRVVFDGPASLHRSGA